MDYVLETERLRLRPLTVDDVDRWVDLHADPQVSEFLSVYTPEQARTRLSQVEARWRERGHDLCAAELTSTGEFVGRIGLQHWPVFDEVEAAWAIHPRFRGHGYVTEAGSALLDWGFDRLDVGYITSMIAPGNLASARVAQRLGFTPLRAQVLGDHDLVVHAITREAWAARRS